MRNRKLSAISPLLLLAVAACGDASSSGDQLSEAEAAELAAEIAQASFFGPTMAAPTQQAPGEQAERITITINETSPCEAGGNSSVSGSATLDYNSRDSTGTMSVTYTVTPSNCAVRTQSGRVFTLSGDPNMKVTGQFTLSRTRYTGSLTYEGGFRWRSDDGRAGGCRVDMQGNYNLTVSQTSVSVTVTVSGQVCGRRVDRTFTYSASA